MPFVRPETLRPRQSRVEGIGKVLGCLSDYAVLSTHLGDYQVTWSAIADAVNRGTRIII